MPQMSKKKQRRKERARANLLAMHENNRIQKELAEVPRFEVDEVLSQSVDANGQSIFLIRWKGFDDKWDTWEPSNNLNTAKKAVTKFLNSQNPAVDKNIVVDIVDANCSNNNTKITPKKLNLVSPSPELSSSDPTKIEPKITKRSYVKKIIKSPKYILDSNELDLDDSQWKSVEKSSPTKRNSPSKSPDVPKTKKIMKSEKMTEKGKNKENIKVKKSSKIVSKAKGKQAIKISTSKKRPQKPTEINSTNKVPSEAQKPVSSRLIKFKVKAGRPVKYYPNLLKAHAQNAKVSQKSLEELSPSQKVSPSNKQSNSPKSSPRSHSLKQSSSPKKPPSPKLALSQKQSPQKPSPSKQSPLKQPDGKKKVLPKKTMFPLKRNKFIDITKNLNKSPLKAKSLSIKSGKVPENTRKKVISKIVKNKTVQAKSDSLITQKTKKNYVSIMSYLTANKDNSFCEDTEDSIYVNNSISEIKVENCVHSLSSDVDISQCDIIIDSDSDDIPLDQISKLMKSSNKSSLLDVIDLTKDGSEKTVVNDKVKKKKKSIKQINSNLSDSLKSKSTVSVSGLKRKLIDDHHNEVPCKKMVLPFSSLKFSSNLPETTKIKTLGNSDYPSLTALLSATSVMAPISVDCTLANMLPQFKPQSPLYIEPTPDRTPPSSPCSITPPQTNECVDEIFSNESIKEHNACDEHVLKKTCNESLVDRRASVRQSESSFKYKEIVVRKCAGFTQIWLFTQTRTKNSLNPKVIAELNQVLQNAIYDDSRVIMLTGSGNTFCSGIDLQFLLHGERKTAARKMADAVRSFVHALISFPKPIVAVINGYAMGLGVAILPLCDMVYASDKAIFHCPYSRLCQTPEGCSSLTFPQIMGTATANDMLLNSRKLTAIEAQQMGLVSQVFWPTTLMQEVIPRLENMSKMSIKSLVSSKQLIRTHLRTKMELTNENECQTLFEYWDTADSSKAIRKFLKDEIDLRR